MKSRQRYQEHRLTDHTYRRDSSYRLLEKLVLKMVIMTSVIKYPVKY